MELNRQDRILKLIVEYFIKTAQPVGSNTLLDEYQLSYSSATIRNEMMELEKAGLIEKTHISSGRVPSAAGYRYYVDKLRSKSVDEEIKFQLQKLLQEKSKTTDEVIMESCAILSHMTNLASIVLGPNASEEKLVSIQLIPLSEKSATAVFVTDQGYVENKTFVTPDTVALKDIEKCVALFNERLRGTIIAELIGKMESMKGVLADYVKDHDVIYQAFLETFLRFATDRFSLFGQSNLMNQPEFASDIQKLKKMISLLDRPEIFRNIAEADDMSEISIHIGEEGDNLDDISVITSKVKIPGHNNGTIAIVGPKRMDYERVVSAMEYLMGELTKYFEESGEDSEGKKEA